jgi:hypothetical protein
MEFARRHLGLPVPPPNVDEIVGRKQPTFLWQHIFSGDTMPEIASVIVDEVFAIGPSIRTFWSDRGPCEHACPSTL